MAENEDKAANHNDLKPKSQQETMLDDDFLLESQQSVPDAPVPKRATTAKTATGRASYQSVGSRSDQLPPR